MYYKYKYKPLPTNIFSMFRVQSGSSHSIPISGGKPKREKRTKKKNTPTIISGQKSISNYLTKSKTMKKETNTHNEHQQLPHKTEYSPGSSAETNKTREKPEAT